MRCKKCIHQKNCAKAVGIPTDEGIDIVQWLQWAIIGCDKWIDGKIILQTRKVIGYPINSRDSK